MGNFTYTIKIDGTVLLWQLTNVWSDQKWHSGVIKDSAGLPRNSQPCASHTLTHCQFYRMETAHPLPWLAVMEVLRASEKLFPQKKSLRETHSSSQRLYVKKLLLFYHDGSVNSGDNLQDMAQIFSNGGVDNVSFTMTFIFSELCTDAPPPQSGMKVTWRWWKCSFKFIFIS